MTETTVCRPLPGRLLAVSNRYSSVARLPNTDAPLRGLEGSDLSARFRHWQGLSGRRYLFSVFPLRDAKTVECPHYEEAVILAVARSEHGERHILWAGETSGLPDLVFEGGAFKAAIARGADEVHMHLLATDQAARDAIIRDLTGEA